MAFNNSKNTQKVTSDELVFRTVKHVVSTNNAWVGTMTDLISEVSKIKLTKEEKSLMPKSPSSFRLTLNKVINRLRNKGISIKFTRGSDYNRTRFVKFTTKNA